MNETINQLISSIGIPNLGQVCLFLFDAFLLTHTKTILGLEKGSLADWAAALGTIGALIFIGYQIRVQRQEFQLLTQVYELEKKKFEHDVDVKKQKTKLKEKKEKELNVYADLVQPGVSNAGTNAVFHIRVQNRSSTDFKDYKILNRETGQSSYFAGLNKNGPTTIPTNDFVDRDKGTNK